MAETIRTVIELSPGLELWLVPVEELKEQDLNARGMSSIMFQRLAETIKRDSRLESLPFCATTKKGIEILSGHHRVRAAREAGLPNIYTLVDTTGLTSSQMKAKQAAHNAINGTDDAALLEEIYKQITSIEDKRESFLINVDNQLKGLKVNEITLDAEMKTIYLAFVPEYFDKWNHLLDSVGHLTDQIAASDLVLHERFRKAMKVVGKAYDIRSVNALMCKFIDIAEAVEASGAKEDRPTQKTD